MPLRTLCKAGCAFTCALPGPRTTRPIRVFITSLAACNSLRINVCCDEKSSWLIESRVPPTGASAGPDPRILQTFYGPRAGRPHPDREHPHPWSLQGTLICLLQSQRKCHFLREALPDSAAAAIVACSLHPPQTQPLTSSHAYPSPCLPFSQDDGFPEGRPVPDRREAKPHAGPDTPLDRPPLREYKTD